MVYPGAIRALLVEDNPGDASLAQDLLAESLGSTIETSCAERLSSAVSWLRQATFDVVILDLLLPDARGLEALTQIVSTAPSMPVVILTGLDDDRIVPGAFDEGAQEFLFKGGVPCEELGRAVEKAICRKRAEMALMDRFGRTGHQLIDRDDIISQTKPAHILVIDPTSMDLVVRAVETHASFFVMNHACTLNEAQHMLRHLRYDAIILNPELSDGWPNDVYENLLEFCRDIPAIVLSTPSIEPCFRRPDIHEPFAVVQEVSPSLLRRLLISATLRSRALEPPVDAAIEGAPQTTPNVWRH